MGSDYPDPSFRATLSFRSQDRLGETDGLAPDWSSLHPTTSGLFQAFDLLRCGSHQEERLVECNSSTEQTLMGSSVCL